MIDHVSLAVSDLARSVPFYEHVFAALGMCRCRASATNSCSRRVFSRYAGSAPSATARLAPEPPAPPAARRCAAVSRGSVRCGVTGIDPVSRTGRVPGTAAPVPATAPLG